MEVEIEVFLEKLKKNLFTTYPKKKPPVKNTVHANKNLNKGGFKWMEMITAGLKRSVNSQKRYGAQKIISSLVLM